MVLYEPFDWPSGVIHSYSVGLLFTYASYIQQQKCGESALWVHPMTRVKFTLWNAVYTSVVVIIIVVSIIVLTNCDTQCPIWMSLDQHNFVKKQLGLYAFVHLVIVLKMVYNNFYQIQYGKENFIIPWQFGENNERIVVYIFICAAIFIDLTLCNLCESLISMCVACIHTGQMKYIHCTCILCMYRCQIWLIEKVLMSFALGLFVVWLKALIL